MLEEHDKKAELRLNELNEKYKDLIERYMFTQYLAKEHTDLAPMKYIADKQVALEKTDAWKLQDIILTDINNNSITLGVPADSFSDKGRCWGMPVLDLKKIFNEDGSLSKSGERLFNIYRKIFRENRNIFILKYRTCHIS